MWLWVMWQMWLLPYVTNVTFPYVTNVTFALCDKCDLRRVTNVTYMVLGKNGVALGSNPHSCKFRAYVGYMWLMWLFPQAQGSKVGNLQVQEWCGWGSNPWPGQTSEIRLSCSEKLKLLEFQPSNCWANYAFVAAIHSVVASAEEAQGESLLSLPENESEIRRNVHRYSTS
jgi:hypothetical protein